MSGTFLSRLADEVQAFKEAAIDKSESYPRQYDGIPDTPTTPKRGPGNAPDKSGIEENIADAITEMFSPWYSLPDPENMDEVMESLGSAKQTLMAGDADVVELEDAEEGLQAPNFFFGNLMADVQDNVENWQGDTVSEFKKNYSNRFQYIYFYQANVLSILYLAAKAEKEAIAHARENVIEVAKCGKEAMQSIGMCGGDDASSALTVVSSVAGVLGAMAGPKGAIVGALVAGAANIAADQIGDDDDDDKPFDIDGSSVSSVWITVDDALEQLKTDLVGSEEKIQRVLNATIESLGEPASLGTDGDGNKVPYEPQDMLRPPEPNAVARNDVLDNVDKPSSSS